MTAISNKPVWNSSTPGGFQEVWYLKANDPIQKRAIWLRFTLLVSANGFRRLAEAWAIFFERKSEEEIYKLAVKQSFDIRFFSPQSDLIRIDDCELSDTHTRGTIQSKGHFIKWNLSISDVRPSKFDMVPEALKRAGIVKNMAVTVHEDIRFTGTTEIDGKTYSWNAAPGMQGHLAGTKNGHSWVWGHCNSFTNEEGQPVSFVFDGLSARARITGAIASPRLSSFYFLYQGKEYFFNSLWNATRSRSKNTLTEWNFQADRGEISFRGHLQAELKDFAGLTYEDTDGSLLYCANSKLSDMRILVYRHGKLESTLISNGTTAFEVVGRNKNPYVALLL